MPPVNNCQLVSMIGVLKDRGAHTLGGMSVDRHRRVTKLILLSIEHLVSVLSLATATLNTNRYSESHTPQLSVAEAM
jgi:hypothetical protein